MKYVIEIIEIDKCPADWTTASNWPGQGIYKVKSEDYCLYHVNKSCVNYINYPEQFTAQPFADQAEAVVSSGEAVSEALLLKAIVAAAHGRVAA